MAIPTKSDKDCLDMLLTIHKEWLSLSKIKISVRESANSKKIIKNFRNKINQLCDLSPTDVEKKLKASRSENWEEDFNFLIGQRASEQTTFRTNCFVSRWQCISFSIPKTW